MRIKVSVVVVLALLTGIASADDRPVTIYDVGLTQPQTQMIDMTMRLREVNQAAMDVMLPVWRPGRYERLDPAGTIQEFGATDGSGRPLPFRKVNTSTWRIDTDGVSEVRVSYRVWANSIATRTRHVDDTHAFLSPSSVFVYTPTRRGHPVEVRLHAPSAWNVATGLEPVNGDLRVRSARDYDVLVDSPIEIGEHEAYHFDVDGVPHEIVIWGESDVDTDQLVTDFTAIIEQQHDIFGDYPFSRYVFMIHVDGGGGGGTEHLNSTIMQVRRSSLEDESAYKRFLGLVSHEYFHTWNVKQLRPACIHPYDYQAENACELFWVAEGTTSYYDDLTLVRGGLITPKHYLGMLSSNIDRLQDRPGRHIQSLEASSFDAWIKFNRRNAHSLNSTVEFYGHGALVNWLIDGHLRRATDDRVSLDDLMREMYLRFPLEGPGFTTEDFFGVAAELSGMDFTDFHSRFVAGVEPLEFDEPLATFGLELVFKPASGDDASSAENDEPDTEEEDTPPLRMGDELPQRAFLGVRLATSGGLATVRSVRSDGPAFPAGIIPDDQIVAIDGRRLDAGDLAERLKTHEPGDTITVHYFRRNELRTVDVTLGSEPDGAWVVRRVEAPTASQRATYERWIGQPWPGVDDDAASPSTDDGASYGVE